MAALALDITNRPGIITGQKSTDPVGTSLFAPRFDTRQALTVPAFLSGLRFLSENLAGFPRFIYQKTQGVRQRDHSHPLDFLLNDEPNPQQDAITFWSAFYADAILGNGYALIDFQDGKPAGLYHLPSERVMPVRLDGKVWYGVKAGDDDKLTPVPADEILHVQGFGDGVKGYSIVDLMKKSLRLSQSAEDYAGGFFERGTGAFSIQNENASLTPEQLADMKGQVANLYGGVGNAHRPLVLHKGWKATQSSSTAEAAQLLQTRQFSILEVARILRCEPFVLYDYSESHYANLDSMNVALVTYTFLPWCLKTEQQINKKLFSKAERQRGYFAGTNTDSLLRGDPTTQNELAGKRLLAGLTTIDEERALLDFPPLPDGLGSKPRVAANTIQLGQQPAPAAHPPVSLPPVPALVQAPPAIEQAPAKQATAEPKPTLEQFAPMVKDAAGRVHRKTGMATANAQKKFDNSTGWIPWANAFSDEQAKYAGEAIAPILESFAAVTGIDLEHNHHGERIGQKYGAQLRRHLYAIDKKEETTPPDLAAITHEHDFTGEHNG
jgi:HK97 family phage portal protein